MEVLFFWNLPDLTLQLHWHKWYERIFALFLIRAKHSERSKSSSCTILLTGFCNQVTLINANQIHLAQFASDTVTLNLFNFLIAKFLFNHRLNTPQSINSLACEANAVSRTKKHLLHCGTSTIVTLYGNGPKSTTRSLARLVPWDLKPSHTHINGVRQKRNRCWSTPYEPITLLYAIVRYRPAHCCFRCPSRSFWSIYTIRLFQPFHSVVSTATHESFERLDNQISYSFLVLISPTHQHAKKAIQIDPSSPDLNYFPNCLMRCTKHGIRALISHFSLV